MNKLTRSRFRHLLFLLPLGAGIGLLIGLVFGDLKFGVLVGTGFGTAYALLLTIRNPG